MTAPTFVVGHKHPDTDSIGSAIGYAHLKQMLGDVDVRPARAGDLNAETRYVLERFALPTPELLTDATGQQVILVDHNEVAQAVDHIQQATVREIWEHHRVGDLNIPQPILFHCEPVGATATLIAEQYDRHHVEPPPAIAAVLLAAILSDTLVFASPTCSDKDRDVAQRLAAIAGLDIAAFGRDLLAARGDTAGRSARDLVEGDFKEFVLAGERVGIGQIETADATPVLARRAECFDELRRLGDEKGLRQVILLVTDIGRKGSHVWGTGDRLDRLERALGQPLVDGATFVEGLMSRKKQLVPPLEQAMSEPAA